MKKFSRSVLAVVVLVLALVVLKSSLVSTYNDEYKLVLQFGKVVKVIEEPGLSFKIPFIQTTQSIPNYEMIYDLVPSEVNTRDKKVMVTDSFALWSVTDPLKYLSRLGANKANAERHRVRKEELYVRIGELYDCSLGNKENLAILAEYGIDISIDTLKRFKKENGLTRKYAKRRSSKSESDAA